MVQKSFIFFVSLYEGVVGFLPAPTCKKLTFFKKDCQCYNSFSYLKRNHIKEQGTVYIEFISMIFIGFKKFTITFLKEAFKCFEN